MEERILDLEEKIEAMHSSIKNKVKSRNKTRHRIPRKSGPYEIAKSANYMVRGTRKNTVQRYRKYF